MHSLKDIQLKCNKQFIVNFDGGELSSDGGLLMMKEFLHILGFEKLLKASFKTNDLLYSASIKMMKTCSRCSTRSSAPTMRTTAPMSSAMTPCFFYQASSWRAPCRVVLKIEKTYNQMIHMYTFIVTNMEELGHWYCNCGRMENFIGEGKQGFGFTAVSSRSKEWFF